MEEQTSWKGHSFTLLVFTGIVVLCSIFFILGMLMGRTQGQKIAMVAVAEAAARSEAKPAPSEEKPNLTFFESVGREKQPALEPALEAPPLEPAKPAATVPAGSMTNYQIGAVRKSGDADKLLNEVKKKGFRAFILAPASGDSKPFFRVLVGPFANILEADEARKKLEAAGYKPILKK